MSKYRILHVEDDIDIGNMMKIYFTALDFDVYTVVRGSDALEKVHQVLPHLVILDVVLPDLDGYEVCRNLRSDNRTSHIPIIFLTQKDERSDKLQGFELGADDYITKPFDIEELKLRVQGTIRRLAHNNITNSRTSLPAWRIIQEYLYHIIQNKENGMALIYLQIKHFEAYEEIYGNSEGDEVLWFTVKLIREVIRDLGLTDNPIGHLEENNFVILLPEKYGLIIREKIKARFASDIYLRYFYIHREQGYILTEDQKEHPFMKLAVGIVSLSNHNFSNSDEVMKSAAEACLLDD